MGVRLPARMRFGFVALSLLLFAGPVSACGVGAGPVATPSNRAAGTPPTSTPSAGTPSTGTPSTGAPSPACADVDSIRSGIAGVENALREYDVGAGQRAWSGLKGSWGDLGRTDRGASASTGLGRVLGPILDAVGDIDSMAKLAAVGAALNAADAALNGAAERTRSALHCPKEPRTP